MTTFTPPTEPEPTPEQRAADADRAWFERHPHATDYRRPAVLGEFGPGLYFAGGRTVVTQFAPGLRHRAGQFAAFEDPEAVAVASTPQWSVWTDGTPVPPEVAAADAACAALVAAVEGEAA